MSITDLDIPDLDHSLAGPQTSPMGGALQGIHRRALSRRTAVKGALVGAAATSLGGISLVGAPRALAATGPKGETEHTNCGGFEYSNSAICFGGSVGSYYCNGSKWHRTDGWSMTCSSGHYYIAWGRCNNREAWRWGYGGTNYRCADGYSISYACGGPSGGTKTWTICKATL